VLVAGIVMAIGKCGDGERTPVVPLPRAERHGLGVMALESDIQLDAE
jgi:hypothetical protein